MDQTVSGFQHISSSPGDLLINDEVIAIVDDDPMIREPIRLYFEDHGLAVIEAASGHEFLEILNNRQVALSLLDIGLPDVDGNAILPQIRQQHPDTVILMLTGVSDLQTALECIRNGADDYLSKPVRLNEIFLSVKKNLEKRRLIIQNRKYQEDLENANFRIQLMHQLSLKMNSVYLNTVELDEILQAILVGITANEGLQFNRAFLALIDESAGALVGRLGIGPGCREEAEHIWGELQEKQLDFFEIVHQAKSCSIGSDNESEVNQLIKRLKVPLSDGNNVLIQCTALKKGINVVKGRANGFETAEIVALLGTDEFVAVPLYSPRRALGLIIADNYVTRRPITEGHMSALELFSSQASLAIEHSHLYMDMQKTIGELESVNYELDQNKDMLIEAERYSALGHMAAQMVHNIRNPITAIGGVSRIVAKKVEGQDLSKYTDVMTKETARLESTLEDLFDFVSQTKIEKEPTQLFPLLRKVLLLVQPDMTKQGVVVEVTFPDPDISIEIDPKHVRKMLVHLFKNAIEAMPEGGCLSVKIVRETDWLVITIINTGKSIDAEQISKVKEPFFTTKTYGTGMGLTMVDRIVTAHNGNFTIANRSNSTEVVVKFPL